MARVDDALWRFSLSLYDRPSVASACLALQDEHGFDVNMVLALIFCARRSVLCGIDDIRRLLELSEEPRRWVASIRDVRRASKTQRHDPETAALYEQCKKAELAAERVVQRRLAQGLLAAGEQQGDFESTARAALRAYGSLLGASAEAHEHFEVLLEQGAAVPLPA